MLEVKINDTVYPITTATNKIVSRLGEQTVTTLIGEDKVMWNAFDSIKPYPEFNLIEVMQDKEVLSTFYVNTSWGRKYDEEKKLSYLFTSSAYDRAAVDEGGSI